MTNILLVDDEEIIRSLLKRVLEEEGYKVEEAANGKIALDKFVQNPSDLVITDVMMPEKAGLETITELRGINPEVKIIAITGRSYDRSTDYLKMAEFLGADFLINKPFEIQKFVDLVGEALVKKRVVS